MKKKLITAAIGAVSLLVLGGCASSTNKDIATMKGGTITVEDFYNEAKLESTNQSLVQRMIIYKVFDNAFGDKVTDKQVTKEYDKQAKQFGDQFEAQLAQAGYTAETYKEYIRNNLVLEAGLKSHIEITDEDLKTAWESFHPEVEAQIIQLASEDEAKEVKKAADNGDDFAKLAKEKSTDTTTNADGGKVTFDSQTTTVPTEVKTAAFALKDGEISDVITATNTSTYATEYYVVKMVSNEGKGNSMDPYKKELKAIAKETKLNDSTFTTEVIGKELKKANVKIKESAFENVLSGFGINTETSSTTSTDEPEATDSTK